MKYNGMELCDFCFSGISEGKPCNVCGFTQENYKYLYNKILLPGSTLADKYIIGRVVRKDEKTTAYLALEKSSSERVIITEFLPSAIVQRASGEEIIAVLPECKNEYLLGAQKFVSEAEKHKENGTVKDVFCANATVYFCSSITNNGTGQSAALDKTLDLNSAAAESKAADSFDATVPPKFSAKDVANEDLFDGVDESGDEALDKSIVFYQMFGDIQSEVGKNERIEYKHSAKAVVFTVTKYGADKESSTEEDSLAIPESICEGSALIEYVLKNRPEWKSRLAGYMAEHGYSVPEDATASEDIQAQEAVQSVPSQEEEPEESIPCDSTEALLSDSIVFYEAYSDALTPDGSGATVSLVYNHGTRQAVYTMTPCGENAGIAPSTEKLIIPSDIKTEEALIACLIENCPHWEEFIRNYTERKLQQENGTSVDLSESFDAEESIPVEFPKDFSEAVYDESIPDKTLPGVFEQQMQSNVESDFVQAERIPHNFAETAYIPEMPKKKKKKTLLIVLLSIGGVLLIAAIVFVLWFFLLRGDGSGNIGSKIGDLFGKHSTSDTKISVALPESEASAVADNKAVAYSTSEKAD